MTERIPVTRAHREIAITFLWGDDYARRCPPSTLQWVETGSSTPPARGELVKLSRLVAALQAKAEPIPALCDCGCHEERVSCALCCTVEAEGFEVV